MRKKISFKGIILGGLTDIIGSSIWGVVVVVYLFTSGQVEMTTNQVVLTRELQAALLHNPAMLILNVLIGGGFTVLGGFISAKIAKHDQLLNGTLASFLCVFFALVSIGSTSIWEVLLSIIGNPLLGLLGGYLAFPSKSKK